MVLEEIPKEGLKELLKMLKDGVSAVEISRRLIKQFPMLHPARVRQEAYSHKIPTRSGPRAGTPGVGRPKGSRDRHQRQPRGDTHARVLELHASGWLQKDIAAELDISPQAVSQHLRSDGNNIKSS
jgi:DNA-binding CsgD family transcriptional regulator